MTEPLVTLRHARQLRRHGGKLVCLPGIAALCARHGVTLEQFTSPGIPGERVLETGDPWALKALAVAREEASHG